jgi:tetratricopeptide (TPR) repeat protein
MPLYSITGDPHRTLSRTLILGSFFIHAYAFTCLAISANELAVPVDPNKQVKLDASATYDWKVHEYNRLNQAGKDSFTDQHYSEAIDYFNQALQFISNEFTLDDKAETLLRLNRPAEALETLKPIKINVKDRTWRLRMQCDLQTKDFKEAMATCDDAAYQTRAQSLSFLMKSQVYEAMGDIPAAKKILQKGIWHCVKSGSPKHELIEALYELGVTPSLDPGDEHK